MNAYKASSGTSLMRPSLVFDEENDLLSDMSFTAMDHNSPFKTKSASMVEQAQTFKKSSTVMPERSYTSKISQPQVSTYAPASIQPSQTQQTTYQEPEASLTAGEKEDLDEDLINEIESYLKDVMEQNEKVIDISETSIGNYGAKCVAAVLSLCEGLEEIRL